MKIKIEIEIEANFAEKDVEEVTTAIDEQMRAYVEQLPQDLGQMHDVSYQPDMKLNTIYVDEI